MTLAFKSKKQSSSRLMGHYSRRGLVLLALGLLFVGFWPANILIIAGVCFFVSPLFIRWESILLQILLFSVILLSTVLGRTPSIEEYKKAVEGINLTKFAPPHKLLVR